MPGLLLKGKDAFAWDRKPLIAENCTHFKCAPSREWVYARTGCLKTQMLYTISTRKLAAK
jgi:hypothetical protein